ncbi:MarR family winged helix-turn-helix transcriptional regulator [Rickettsiella endosymbiont of Dermanyssus gallinae]|uniref:MarR family winged helix-turn-helix transcriptional regulator n=1 Tax=Rickettsiella endosymbiont of Dermanyssus gallinae TaxID=2856608 RepID=UPI001C52E1BA|nr:MarR family winged helix-turn-helix transcriptional regulator [Rickettsiella endosymbiont of Dermanyssus gallinae]
MKLTSRDVEILKFINEFGFCEMPQISQYFGLHKPRNYQIINKLERHKLLLHERIFYRRHGLYRLTPAGARFSQLPPLHRVPLANYHHDYMVLNLFMKLKAIYPDSSWISERKLKHDKYKLGVGQHGHLPDGILVFADGKQIAIEVELSYKSNQRLEDILKTYATQFALQEVWYFCHESMVPKLKEAAKAMPFVKIHVLKTFLEKQLTHVHALTG